MGCCLVEIKTFCIQNYKLCLLSHYTHICQTKSTTSLLEAPMQPHGCRADIPLCHQNKQEIGNFNWRCAWCAMRPLENECFWQVWTKARPKTADGGKAADVNVVIFFHMFFCFAVISTLSLNCQWLKTWEKPFVRNILCYLMPFIRERDAKGENRFIDLQAGKDEICNCFKHIAFCYVKGKWDKAIIWVKRGILILEKTWVLQVQH